MKRSQSRGPQSLGCQVWDPGARILIYTQHNNNNVTKDITPVAMHRKLINTRASPNKSQDSGFSDSGESETSSSDLSKGILIYNFICLPDLSWLGHCNLSSSFNNPTALFDKIPQLKVMWRKCISTPTMLKATTRVPAPCQCCLMSHCHHHCHPMSPE